MYPRDSSRLEAMLQAYFAADRAVTALSSAFHAAGRELYLVGGYVRDLLLERADRPDNLDFATDARPEESVTLLYRAGASGIYTVGARFGTVGASKDGRLVEVTTYRSESYRHGDRHPDVRFGTSLREDLARRDLSINAMAIDVRTGALIDQHGGRDDLAAGRVRMVGSPAERFEEDPLRLMRAVRIATQLGFSIEPETAAAVKAMAQTLLLVSKERVRDELVKILLTPRPDEGMRQLSDLGLLRHIMPPVEAMRGMVDPEKKRFKDLFAHTLRVLAGTPADLTMRLAALLHDVGKPQTYSLTDGQVHFFEHERIGALMARRLLTELHVDRATVDAVVRLIEFHMRPAADTDAWTDKAIRRFIVDVTPEALPSLFSLAKSDITSSNPARVTRHLDRLVRLEERCAAIMRDASVVRPRSPLDGDELMAIFGGKPGPWIGKVKENLLQLVIDGELGEDDKARAEELARVFIAEHGLLEERGGLPAQGHARPSVG